MKITFVSIVGLIFILTSCGTQSKQPSQEEIVYKNAEEYIKSKMNDPESYEFAELELVDSVLYSDNIYYRRNRLKHNIENNLSEIEQQERYKKNLPLMFDEKKVQDLKAKIERNKRILIKIDSLETVLRDKKNEVASYTYIFSFRGNNALGAKMLNDVFIQTNSAPDFKIINMTDDEDELFLNPNDFPGYKEMIQNNM